METIMAMLRGLSPTACGVCILHISLPSTVVLYSGNLLNGYKIVKQS